MMRSILIPAMLLTLSATLLLSPAVNAASYIYTGRDGSIEVEVGKDYYGRPIRRILDLRNGRQYDDAVIGKLPKGLHWQFAGYGAPVRPMPTNFESGRSYMYTGRDGSIEVEVGKDYYGRPIRRILDLRNGSFYSGDTINKLGRGLRSQFILRAAAPIALVAGGLGLTAEPAEASQVRRVGDGGPPNPIGLTHSNVGESSNSLVGEEPGSYQPPSQKSFKVAR
jgi:hypothetical protein